MERAKIIRLVLIPVVMALVVTLIVRQTLARPMPVIQAPTVEMASVVAVAAKGPLASRTKITEADLVIRQVPNEVLTGREVTSVAEAVGQITLVAMEPGEMLMKSRIVQEGEGALPYRIPTGMRAITIRIDELLGVAGHPEPGDLVDMLLFLPASKERPATARLMFESVLVLEKGPASTAVAAKQGVGLETAKLTSITLALPPSAGVEVALAEQIGLIKLMLRPATDEQSAGAMIIDEQRYSLETGE
jgi:pilus assembly protein CpaB